MIDQNEPGVDGAAPLLTMHITEVLPHLHHQLGPHSEVLLHPSGPQVQVAVLHPQRLRFLSNRKTETQRFAIHSDHKYHST